MHVFQKNQPKAMPSFSLTQECCNNSLVLAQDKRHAALCGFGLDQAKSQVVGNIKFDIHAPEFFIKQAEQLKQEWHLPNRKLTLPVHAPEEEQILRHLHHI
jgi:3-deoxy-D-manno-octulosonic-acid transferase